MILNTSNSRYLGVKLYYFSANFPNSLLQPYNHPMFCWPTCAFDLVKDMGPHFMTRLLFDESTF